jgi:hypothetical protein
MQLKKCYDIPTKPAVVLITNSRLNKISYFMQNSSKARLTAVLHVQMTFNFGALTFGDFTSFKAMLRVPKKKKLLPVIAKPA